METKDFYGMETECELEFRELGRCFHLCTNENAPILFHDEREFKTAMNIVGLLSFLHPEVVIITFEIMSNHMHFAVTGEEESIRRWFDDLVKKMKTHPELSESRSSFDSLSHQLIDVCDLRNVRNVIAYINRNGYVISPDGTPFSYLWGANRYFFNTEAKLRYECSGKKLSFMERREMFRSNKGDSFKEIVSVDGYVSPLCFCKIGVGEQLFRNARHYFSMISKNVEAFSEIARDIGESLFYTDEDLYSLVVAFCQKNYGIKSPKQINADAKIALAKKLRFEYNSGNKQISRILGMDINAVSAIFPGNK